MNRRAPPLPPANVLYRESWPSPRQVQRESAVASAVLSLLSLGPHAERDLAELLAPASLIEIRAALAVLRDAGRIEESGRYWRIVPARPVPTRNPGTR